MSDLSIRGTNKIVFGPFIVMTCIVILPLLVLGQTGPDLSEIPLARPRITQEIDDSKPVQLKGHVHPKAKAQYDQGEVAPSFGMDYVTLLLKPSVEQRVAMDKLLAELQDRSSPNYHNWLTVEEYADRFGLSDSDVSRTVAWLEAKGLTIKYVAHGRDWVAFGGTADQVEKTFHTKIHRYRVDGEEHYANATAPSIPAALAGVVSYIQGLDDFRPKPLYTEGSGKHELAPDDVATIYHVNALYGAGMDGTGQAIVVVGQSDINLADILEFRNTFGLPIFIPQRLQQPTGLDPGLTGDKNEEEGDLDVEWAGALARTASI
jgi:subtilase family serine protease